MKEKQLITLLILLTGLLLTHCSQTKKVAGDPLTYPSLKETFKDDFLVGTALSAAQIEEKDTGAARLIPQQFNAVTPENVMKAKIIHPQWGKYNYEFADKLVDYASKNKLQVTATPLIWHSQLPPFLSQVNDADSIRQYFEEHITTIAKRYDGKVYSWEVVNEALDEDGTLRKTLFLQKLGDDYIVEAFRLAQRVAPQTKLYYNDYNIELPRKRAGAIELIKKFRLQVFELTG